MNIETIKNAMIKRAAGVYDDSKHPAQTPEEIQRAQMPEKIQHAQQANMQTGVDYSRQMQEVVNRAQAQRAQQTARNMQATQYAVTAAKPQTPPAPSQNKGPLQRIIEAGRAAYQNGQTAGQKINEYAKANPLLDWNDGTREHLGDTYTENLRRLADAWDKGVRIGEDTAAANEPQAKAIDQAIGEIQRDPRSTIQDVQNAEQNGVFSKGLNNLLLYLRNRKAQAPAVTAPAATGSTEIAR